MRENLIELLDDIQRFGAGYTYFELYGMRMPDEVFNNEVADHLIANGVTIPVRCKDCKYKDERIHACTNVKFRGERIHIWVEPDDFCSYGERRTNVD